MTGEQVSSRNWLLTTALLLYPAAAQRLVQLHVVLQFRVPRLFQAQRRHKVLLLVVLHLEKAGDAALEAHFGEVGHLLVGMRLLLKLHAVQARLAVADKTVGNVPKGLEHGSLVGQFRFVPLRPGKAIVGPDPASLVEGLDGLPSQRPECRGSLKEACYGGALRAEDAGE